MRADLLRFKGIGPAFPGLVEIAFDSIPGKVCAVVGENGAGKSTALGLIPCAMYRDTPAHGSLADLATGRDSFVELHGAWNGRPLVLRQEMDGVSGKGESVVTDATGKNCLKDRKVSSFDAWAADNLPPSSVLFASMFSPQGKKGFLGLGAADRKAVLLRILGSERLEGMAKAARGKAATAKAEFATALARISDEVARATSLADAEAELAKTAGDLEAAEQNAKLASDRLDAARAEADRVRAHNEEQARKRTERARIVAAEEQASAAVNALTSRILATHAPLEDRQAFERAVVELAALDMEIADRRQRHSAAQVAHASAVAELMAAERALAAAQSRVGSLTKSVADGRAAVASMEEDLKAEATVAHLEKEIGAQEHDIAELDAELERLRGKTVADAGARIEALRVPLDRYAGMQMSEWDEGAMAQSAIHADNKAVADRTEIPRRIEKAAGAKRHAVSTMSGLQTELIRARARVARAAGLPAARQRLEADLIALAEVSCAQGRPGSVQREDARMAESNVLVMAAHLRDSLELRQALAEKAAMATELVAAAATMAEIERQLVGAETALLNARAAVANALAAAAVDPLPLPNVQDFQAAERDAVFMRNATCGAHDRAKYTLASATASAAKLAKLTEERLRLETDLSDWIRLGDDLGRDGLQAALVDNCGPELTETANLLLHECLGTRFSVAIETQRVDAKGKRMLEGCAVMVTDTVNGREAPGEDFSGGEVVLIAEACSLALNMMACRRWGITGATLVRDESGAALSDENGRAYVQMLRRAAELAGFSRVFLVTHNRDLQEMCDARLEVRGGKFLIDGSEPHLLNKEAAAEAA